MGEINTYCVDGCVLHGVVCFCLIQNCEEKLRMFFVTYESMNVLKLKNGFGKVLVVALLFAFVFVAGLITGRYVVNVPGLAKSETVFEFGGVEGASYVIFKEGSIYYARNGKTGVTDYSGTDASKIIQNAIGAITSGGIIHISVGVYEIRTTIKVKPQVILEGEGGSAIFDKGTILRLADGVNTNIIENENVGTADRYIIIRQLALDGNKDNNDAGSGISFTRVERCSIQNVDIWNCEENGLVISGETGVYGAYENNIYNLVVSYCDGDGILLTTTTGPTQDANDNRFYGVFVRNCNYGVNIDVGTGNTFFGAIFAHNVVGIYINRGTANYFYGTWGEPNSDKSVFFAFNSSRNYVDFTSGWAGSSYDEGKDNVVMRAGHFLAGYLRLSNVAHPDTTEWGTNEKGRVWFCTTHNCIEYWNGTDVIQVK